MRADLADGLELKPAEPVEGIVVEERGSPVEGVSLRLASVKGEGPDLTPATSGAQGRFTLDAPRPGAWRLVAHHPDFLTGDVPFSAPARDVRVVLRRGASLEVEVVDEAGRPLEHAEVFVKGLGRGVTTGADGRAVFRSLVPGGERVGERPGRRGAPPLPRAHPDAIRARRELFAGPPDPGSLVAPGVLGGTRAGSLGFAGRGIRGEQRRPGACVLERVPGTSCRRPSWASV